MKHLEIREPAELVVAPTGQVWVQYEDQECEPTWYTFNSWEDEEKRKPGVLRQLAKAFPYLALSWSDEEWQEVG